MRLGETGVQYQRIKFGQLASQITADREAQLKPFDHLPRGGAAQAAKVKVHLQCIDSLAQAFVESYIEAYQKAGLSIDSEDAEVIISELRGHVNSWFSSLRTQPHIGRFLATQPTDANSVVARARQAIFLNVSEGILAQNRVATDGLKRMILEKLNGVDIAFTTARLKVSLAGCRIVADEQWFTALADLRRRGFVGSPTPAGPFVITAQGKNYLQSLQTGTAQPQETIMRDKYEIHGQVGAVGPHATAHDLNFIQEWAQQPGPVDLGKLADELTILRQAMLEKAAMAEHYTAIGEIASAETQAKNGNGPGVLEHLSKAGKWALDLARETGVQVAAELILRASGLTKEAP